MKLNRTVRILFSLLLAMGLLASTAFATPSSLRPHMDTITPQGAYVEADMLADYIRLLHIDSGINDNPLLRAWQSISGTRDDLSPNQLRQALQKYFAEDPGHLDSFETAMLHVYDPFSNLFTESGYEESYGDNRDYEGLGFVYRAWGPMLILDDVYSDSPAGRAGLQRGDFIVKIAGKDIRFLSDAKRTELMEEYRGRALPFTVLRDGKLLDYEIEAGKVYVPSMEHEILDGKIGYLSLQRFSGDHFDDELKAAVTDFRKAGVKSLILDLQGNHGGGIEELLTAINAFVPQADRLLFTELSRSYEAEYYSVGGGLAVDRMLILADGDSASSAEIFTGCLSDLGLATVIGTPTYGKGRGQAGYFFNDRILMISVSAVALPVRGRYDGTGLIPDIEVADTVTVDIEKLEPLDTGAPVSAASSKSQILALEQRLELLGFLYAEADGVFDDATAAALASFYAGMGAAAKTSADTELLRTLADMTKRADGAVTVTDDPLLVALDLLAAGKAA